MSVMTAATARRVRDLAVTTETNNLAHSVCVLLTDPLSGQHEHQGRRRAVRPWSQPRTPPAPVHTPSTRNCHSRCHNTRSQKGSAALMEHHVGAMLLQWRIWHACCCSCRCHGHIERETIKDRTAIASRAKTADSSQQQQPNRKTETEKGEAPIAVDDCNVIDRAAGCGRRKPLDSCRRAPRKTVAAIASRGCCETDGCRRRTKDKFLARNRQPTNNPERGGNEKPGELNTVGPC